MATNYNYPDPANVEAAAQYRPGVASRLFNVLTGGLGGAITGTTERAQEAARARQALLQEEFQKRDEQRILERQLMINALQQGIAPPTGQTFEEKMADFNRKRLRSELAGAAAGEAVYGDQMGPSPYEGEPAYQSAAARARFDVAQQLGKTRIQEKIQAPELRAQLQGISPGTKIPEDATAGQLRGLLEKTRMQAQSQVPMEQRAEQARADLRTLQSLNAFPSPINIESLAPQEAISQAEIYGRKYQQENYIGQFDRTQKAQQEAFNKFNDEASLDAPDPNKLKGLYAQLPVSLQRDPEIKRTAGITTAPSVAERKTLSGWKDTLDRATNLASSISALAGTEDLSKISQQNFNGVQSWLRSIRNKYGTEDPRISSINTIIQQFEQVVAGTRKDLFGASLTGNELQSARQQFGDPTSANFLPRMVSFLDNVFSKDLVAEYKDNMISVPPGLAKSADEARQNWLKTREQFNFGSLVAPRKSADNRLKNLQDEAARLRQALGMTNAPATTR